MSLTALRPYFRGRLASLGFTEWPEPFDFQNIPSNIIDRSFNLELGSVAGIVRQNLHHEFDAQVTIRAFFKGFREPANALDEAIARAELILKDCCKVENWGPTALKGITVQSVDFLPLDNDLNDNVVFCSIVFAVGVNVCIE